MDVGGKHGAEQYLPVKKRFAPELQLPELQSPEGRNKNKPLKAHLRRETFSHEKYKPQQNASEQSE